LFAAAAAAVVVVIHWNVPKSLKIDFSASLTNSAG